MMHQREYNLYQQMSHDPFPFKVEQKSKILLNVRAAFIWMFD